jgi:hypothetical protein
MIPETLKPEDTALKRWVFFDDVLKYTGNKALIAEELELLRKMKTPVEIRGDLSHRLP